jgi:23S rRNA (uracil1939-C5)-methyltransferase
VAIATELAPIPCQRFALPDAWHYVPISSFVQVNETINLALVQDLVIRARQLDLRTFCDLYAGSGNFSLPLVAAGLSGDSVELDSRAVDAARRAAEVQAFSGLDFAIGDAGAFAEQALVRRRSFDLVVVDPPRAGIRQHLPSIAALCDRYLVYCSCNPGSLARDLARLVSSGFELESVALYDMFEHTHHVETMVWLRAPRRK